jgi:hypothetical protein
MVKAVPSGQFLNAFGEATTHHSPLYQSILVLLEVPLQHQQRLKEIEAGKYVSILVLLEVPLQQIDQKDNVIYISRFNPCFTGSTTST